MDRGRQFLADVKFNTDYAKWREDLGRKETWTEAVQDVMNMHREYYANKMTPELEQYINNAEIAYRNKEILASQRNLQFRKEQIFKHPSRLFNCSVTYLDRPKAFAEVMYQLLCGCGVGFSVQKRNIDKLPDITKRNGDSVVYEIRDEIEGWADAIGVLLSSFFTTNQQFPEFFRKKVIFDYSQIRPKGSFISGGFKAPGPDGLRKSLENIEKMFKRILNEGHTRLRGIDAHDICCYAADAVLSGGVRRSAQISIFDVDDQLMLEAKTGNWFVDNPQRGRANNSAILIKGKTSKEQFEDLMEKTKQFGEPGIFWAQEEDIITNPCVTPDTDILTTKGWKKVMDLVGKQFSVKFNGNLYNSTKEGFFSQGIKEIYTLYASNGCEIDCTANHKFLTPDGWVELKNLNPMDEIYCTKELYPDELEVVTVQDVIHNGEHEVFDCTIEEIHKYVSNRFISHNCGEIGFVPIDEESGNTGWSMCNLCEINGGLPQTKEEFLRACENAAVIGTLQAGYTNFKYLNNESKKIIEKEALLGVSITGWMSNPKLFNKEWLHEGVEVIKKVNEKVAKIIGINKAARLTCVKPSGNASVILGTTSGIHGEHSPLYFRVMQLNKETEIAKYLDENYPEMLEEGVWSSTNSDYAVYTPVIANKDSIYKNELYDEILLEKVKFVQENWVEPGTRPECGIKPYIRHNVSNTVSVTDWDAVSNWVFKNQNKLGGLSFLPASGDKVYQQAPFTSVLSRDNITAKYKDGALLASGLVVDGNHAFKGNLWNACDAVKNKDYKLTGTRQDHLLQKDWIRRAKKFAKNYFNGNVDLMIECLKDIHLFHKWHTINRIFEGVDFNEMDMQPSYIDVDTIGAKACSGGACEIEF